VVCHLGVAWNLPDPAPLRVSGYRLVVPGFSDLFERFDPDPNVRGRQFEQICRWYLKNDPSYRRMLHQVWLWDDWPGRTGPDTGIDLVAEDRQGYLWAIQAKAYNPDHPVTKHDIDSYSSVLPGMQREAVDRLATMMGG